MRAIFSMLILVLTAGIAGADEAIVERDSDTEFPATLNVSIDGQDIELRAAGTGLRKKAWFKVYAAAFYVERSVDLAKEPFDQAINGDFPKRIVMHFLRDVGANKIRDAFRDGIRKNLGDDFEAYEGATDEFCQLFVEDVANGEAIVLTYLPERGLEAVQAGELLGEIADARLIAAIWATWFGEDPISDDLKEGLVGL